MNKKLKSRECVYCGNTKHITNDHIPPKNLFPPPRPNNLITVPCCQNCNQNASKDDEYFRDMLTMRIDTYEHPDVTKNWQTVLRSLNNPHKTGMRKSIMSTLKEVSLYTPAGIYLGKSGMLQVDVERLLKVTERIIKGIFYFENGFRLPTDYNVKSFFLESIRMDKDVINLISMAKTASPKTIGNGVFTYWLKPTIEDLNTNLLLLLFYEKVAFMGFAFK